MANHRLERNEGVQVCWTETTVSVWDYLWTEHVEVEEGDQLTKWTSCKSFQEIFWSHLLESSPKET